MVRQNAIRVLVVDDHQLVRVGTSRLLEDIEGIVVVGQAENGEQAIEMVQELEPDVVLMDVQMPGIGGLEATRRCLRIDPMLKVVAVTIHGSGPYPSQLLNVGAAGYLTKNADVDEMVRAIKKVMAGQRYISTEVAQQLALRSVASDDKSPFDSLSGREVQIMLLVVIGQSVAEISDKLSLSPKTINSYRYRIFEKLEVKNDVALTRMAIKHGVVDGEGLD
jgi:two-component system invasion response regulator UvrY